MRIRQNKLMGYLAVTAGVGCASSVANAAVVFYGNASNPNIQADPQGISIFRSEFRYQVSDPALVVDVRFRYWGGEGYFSRGEDWYDATGFVRGYYFSTYYSRFAYGAVAGDQNYVNISFNGHDFVYEAVGQFFFDGMGGGYLMAIATINDIPNPQNLSSVGGPALSISAGKAMIDAAAIPEPSSLVLLALGATGLAARRQRKKAA